MKTNEIPVKNYEKIHHSQLSEDLQNGYIEGGEIIAKGLEHNEFFTIEALDENREHVDYYHYESKRMYEADLNLMKKAKNGKRI